MRQMLSIHNIIFGLFEFAFALAFHFLSLRFPALFVYTCVPLVNHCCVFKPVFSIHILLVHLRLLCMFPVFQMCSPWFSALSTVLLFLFSLFLFLRLYFPLLLAFWILDFGWQLFFFFFFSHACPVVFCVLDPLCVCNNTGFGVLIFGCCGSI